MTAPPEHRTPDRLGAFLGAGREWTAPHGASATVWETPAYHLMWAGGAPGEPELRRLWEDRKGRSANVVILLAASPGDPSALRVAGPQDARPVRELPAGSVLALLEAVRDLAPREAASRLSREFARLEEAVVPGVRVKELLTPHFVRERLRWPENGRRLAGAAERAGAGGLGAWRALYEALGYEVEELSRGYLLRYDNAPVAVAHPHRSPESFARLTGNGELPEGMALADCDRHGAHWAVLTAGSCHRLFQRSPPVGAATGRYVEIDTRELGRADRLYLGLLAPESLCQGGWLDGWVREAKDFGEQLRKGLEERLIRDALPRIARGLGEHLESQGADLDDRDQLRRIEEAALTLVFRIMFLLHTEARGYLPVGSAAYRPHSARQLAEDSRAALVSLSLRSTQRWDRLRTLVRMVRAGDPSAGVPAYNGSLFAAAGFPGSELLERAEIADVHLAPALAAIAFETGDPGDPGLDYAGLQIGHLGAIYEALLTLRLTRAPEDLAYDPKRDVFRPMRAGEQAEVTRAQLYYQAEAGGRKAGGVFYTRHEFVRHLLEHSLAPALDAHLDEVRQAAARDRSEGERLFDFSVVDPAMGSAHFLTAALDMMADRIELFLAEIGGLPAVARLLGELRDDDDAEAARRPDDGDLLRRLILKRCIYGVDLSPMAVEVANVTLWLASFVPGLALSYLGSNLKCGDALIGVADPAVVGAAGSTMVQRLDAQPVRDAMNRAAELQRELAEIPDRDPAEVKRSEELGAALRRETAGLRAAFDLWAADPLGLDGARRVLEANAGAVVEGGRLPAEAAGMAERASAVAERYRFFHWPLEFPQVFHRERPGFDVVVGNPPWNKVKFERPSFLALHDPGIRGLRSGLERDEREARLLRQRPELEREIEELNESIQEQRKFFRPVNGYTMQGSGDTDLYKLFCERYASIGRAEGFIGVVLPRVAFLNDGSRGFRRWFFGVCRPSRIDAILNNRRWAFEIHPQFSIALVTAQIGVPSTGALTVTGPARSEREFALAIGGPGVQVDLEELASWTPPPADDSVKAPTWELPLLPTPTHAGVLRKLRRGVRFDRLPDPQNPKIAKGAAAPLRATPYRELDEAVQRHLFTHPPGEGRVSVWKGRTFDQYAPHGNELAGHGPLSEI